MGERTRPTALERFEANTQKTETCWLWTARLNASGYGTFGVNGKRSTLVHRWSFENFVGPIPDGLVIDHLCRVRNCVNPDHLEAVTQRENILRGVSRVAMHAKQTHCLRGHLLAGDNLRLLASGERACRSCEKIRAVKQRPAARERMRAKRQDPEYLAKHREYMRDLRRRKKAEHDRA
jgi:hypothetical protein